jgi:hypothetical protein
MALFAPRGFHQVKNGPVAEIISQKKLQWIASFNHAKAGLFTGCKREDEMTS